MPDAIRAGTVAVLLLMLMARLVAAQNVARPLPLAVSAGELTLSKSIFALRKNGRIYFP